jgi:hypothetical protein
MAVNDSEDVLHFLKHYGSEMNIYAARLEVIWQLGQDDYDACVRHCDICN